MTHICVSKLIIIGSDNGLSPGRRQTIIQTDGGILLIRQLRTNRSEIRIQILTLSLKKMHLKVSSAKWRPFCLSLFDSSIKMASYFQLPVYCPFRKVHSYANSYGVPFPTTHQGLTNIRLRIHKYPIKVARIITTKKKWRSLSCQDLIFIDPISQRKKKHMTKPFLVKC